MRKSTPIFLAVLLAITSGCTQDHDRFVLPEFQATPANVTPPEPPPAEPPPEEPPPEEPPPEEPPPEEPPPVAPMNVAGTWFSRAENNAVNCGMGQYTDGKSMFIAQDEADFSMLTSSGDEFIGTVNGNIVEWTGSYAERNGETDYTAAQLVFSTDSAAGNASWTWTDGVDSCNGTMAIIVNRTAMSESASNSRPEIADQFDFTDNVAFFTGTLGEGIDATDYFSFTATTDGILQAELSHFDLTSTNLDLQILDENLQQIGSSASVDSFEVADAAIVAGQRYYVRVDATSIAGPDNYNLALDIN